MNEVINFLKKPPISFLLELGALGMITSVLANTTINLIKKAFDNGDKNLNSLEV